MPRDAAIFDIGQGTGLLGKLLAAEGFTNIDGADASQNFVDTANKTGWYKNCSVVWFGKGVENLPKELLGKYDIVMASGVFLDGHIPDTGFDDAHAMCKPGGYFVTSIRRSYYERGEEHGYREKLDQPFVSPGGRVALLGDAAHPQTPFLGQGCNMALAEAFATCTRLLFSDIVTIRIRIWISRFITSFFGHFVSPQI